MFGYMGFGMQSWIYRRNPRKSFAKRERLPSFNSLPTCDKDFELTHHIVENNQHYGIITLLVGIGLIISTGFFSYKFYQYSSEHTKLVNEYTKSENQKAFNFLMNSGNNRLKTNDFVGAYSEFKIAFEINSTNEELNKLIVETLSILCEKEKNYCYDLDIFVMNF